MLESANDIDWLEDLNPYFTEIGGRAALAQRCARRLQCIRGRNPADTENYGINIRDYLNRNMTESRMSALEAEVEGQIKQESQVLKVTAKGQIDLATQSLSLRIRITDRQGVFQLNVDTLPVEASPSIPETPEEDVATQLIDMDSKEVIVTGTSQPHLAALAGRKTLTVQNLSKLVDIYYQIGKNCTTASLVIPAKSEKEFDGVAPGALYLMTTNGGEAVCKIEWGW